LFISEAESTISTMPLRKSREQREAERAEMDERDRDHAARLAALNAAQLRPPLFCQACDARLKPAAVRCHYCGSEDLAVSQVSCPFFSEVAVDGACPRCHGRSFRTPEPASVLATGGLLAGGLAGAAAGAAIGAAASSDLVLCVTCGARFRRG